MKKSGKILFIVITSILAIALLIGGTVFWMIGNAANAEEYSIGNDSVKSIKAVVEKRDVTSIRTEIKNGIKSKQIEYQSASVQEDLVEYVQYLRTEGGFELTKDMDLTQMPSTVQLAKESEDPGEILIMTIEYDAFGYTITLQKGKGSLTLYD